MDVADVVIWIVIGLVVLALVAGLVIALRKRKQQRQAADHARAEELRREAAAHTPKVTQSQLEAREASAQAALARAEAERAERRATEAQQGLQVEQARQEDAIREADRIDPHVDHRAADYSPGATGAPGTHTGTEATSTHVSTAGTSTGSHTPPTATPPADVAPPAPRTTSPEIDEATSGKHRGTP